MQGWIDLFRSLGESLVEVWRAEMANLQGDLERSGRHLGMALAFLGVAAVLFFWIVGLLLFVMITVLHIWLELWAAALIVLGLFVLAACILGWLGARQIRQVENPMSTVRRRVDSHLDWWQHGLLAKPQTLDVEPVATGDEPLGGGRNLS
ncbi:MAG TPA: phage holin family protein [Thermoanaerobaculia bacterium]|nr:phage holin family protein [Thermoanaerobaculia bacterium]